MYGGTMSQPEAAGLAAEPVPAAGAASRLVTLIEAVAAAPVSVGVRELSRSTGIDKSAVSRLLAQLQRLGIVEQAPQMQGRYVIGPRLFTIGALVAARDTLTMAARPVMRRLVDVVDESCYLAVLEQGELVFRDKADCLKPIRYVLEMGRPMPIHAGAGGRAVLAGMDPEAAASLLRGTVLEKVTPRTVSDVDTLVAMAAEDRRVGYSVSFGERVIGGAAVAAPYFTGDGSCRGALVLTVPSERLDPERAPELGAAVADAAAQLSARLGYSRATFDLASRE